MTKKERIDYFNKEVLHELESLFDVRILAENSYRIESRINNRRVDYFPKSEKAFLLNEQKWGRIEVTEIIKSLKTYLKHE